MYAFALKSCCQGLSPILQLELRIIVVLKRLCYIDDAAAMVELAGRPQGTPLHDEGEPTTRVLVGLRPHSSRNVIKDEYTAR